MRYIIYIGLYLIVSGSALAEIPKEKAVYAIIGEFENDNLLAGACALRARDSLRGVYGINSPRVKQRLYSSATLVRAVKAWEESASSERCRFIGGAEHWQSYADMRTRQAWRDRCQMTFDSGKTKYFKCGGKK